MNYIDGAVAIVSETYWRLHRHSNKTFFCFASHNHCNLWLHRLCKAKMQKQLRWLSKKHNQRFRRSTYVLLINKELDFALLAFTFDRSASSLCCASLLCKARRSKGVCNIITISTLRYCVALLCIVDAQQSTRWYSTLFCAHSARAHSACAHSACTVCKTRSVPLNEKNQCKKYSCCTTASFGH